MIVDVISVAAETLVLGDRSERCDSHFSELLARKSSSLQDFVEGVR